MTGKPILWKSLRRRSRKKSKFLVEPFPVGKVLGDMLKVPKVFKVLEVLKV
jgi:hypothetical protein